MLARTITLSRQSGRLPAPPFPAASPIENAAGRKRWQHRRGEKSAGRIRIATRDRRILLAI
ncbi:hypothetical protein LH19_18630 [Sphingopyxis macrogoltabida]|nr:hypothetical protein LH19_18630 [Sphingopyxis macrogoltabida]